MFFVLLNAHWAGILLVPVGFSLGDSLGSSCGSVFLPLAFCCLIHADGFLAELGTGELIQELELG